MSSGLYDILGSLFKEKPSKEPLKSNDDETESAKVKEGDVKIFADVLEDEMLEQQTERDAFNKLLQPSELMIKDIWHYVQSQNIVGVPVAQEIAFTGTTAFIYNGVKYELTPEDAQIIYANMLNLDAFTTLSKVASRKPNTLKYLLQNLSKHDCNFKDIFLMELDFELIKQLSQKALSITMNNILDKNPRKSDITVNKNTLAVSIGRIMLDSYMWNKYLYVQLDKKELKQQKLAMRLNLSNNEFGTIKGYKKRTIEELSESLELFKAMGFTKEGIKEKKLLEKYSQTSINKIITIMAYLQKTIILSSLTEKETTEDTLYGVEKELIISYTNIGLDIISWLVKNGVLEETISKKHNIPVLRIVKQYETCVYTPSSHYKPPISHVEFITEHTFRKGYVDFTIDINREPIPNKKTTHIKSTDELLTIIKGAGLIPFCIDINSFQDYIELAKQMMELDLNDERRIAYLSTIYDIDFNTYIEQYKKETKQTNITNTIIENLLKYAQKLDVYEYDEENIQIKEHLSLSAAYKKIRSYKYFLRGLLNDLNLYSHFEYFFIPKYAVSTGRLQSSPYYLQLQGNKAALPFINCYYSNNRNLQPDDFELLHEKILKLNPDITELDIPDTLETFNLLATNLYMEQASTFVNSDVNIHEYKLDNISLIENFMWLYNNCKKIENVFYLWSLLSALKYGTINAKLIKKDATGSGPQIISMLTEDESLMLLTNIKGSEYYDLYNKMLVEFEGNNFKQKAILDEFLKLLFNVTYEEFANGDILEGKQNIIYKLIFMNYSQTKRKDKNSNKLSEFESLYKKNKKVLEEKRAIIENMTFKIINPSIDISQKEQYLPRDKMYATLTKIRLFRENYEAYNSIPKEMLNRKLFKKWIMAFAYAQGRKSRGLSLRESFLEFYISKGYSKIPISDDLLDLVIDNLSTFFDHYSIKNFKSLKFFLENIKLYTSEYLKNSKNSFKVELKYCTWSLRCHDNLETRHRFMIDGFVHQFTLYHKLHDSTNNIGGVVPSIFVQGIEAHFIHELYSRILEINKYLEIAQIPLITISTNHDSIGINQMYGPLLVPLMQQCYNTISSLKFPKLDDELKRKYISAKCTNPNFIRF